MARVLTAALLLALLCIHMPAGVAQDGQEDLPQGGSVRLTEGLALPGVGSAGRSPIHTSNLLAALVDGSFKAPKAGDKVRRDDGSIVEWRAIRANEAGQFSEPNTAYIHCTFDSPKAQVMVLHARGYATVYVNGEPRGGDVYNYGYVQLPVNLKAGANHFLFNTGRGGLEASLYSVNQFDTFAIEALGSDVTLPDVVAGQTQTCVGAVRLMNRSARERVVYVYAEGQEERLARRHTLPAMTTRKVPFSFTSTNPEPGILQLKLTITEEDSVARTPVVARLTLEVRSVSAGSRRKVTFLSQIDGSVQYYSVVPAQPLPGATDKPGIVLSLHGASVEATNQAASYSPKTWCHIVCPTNRRPFGFDWEDWGRMDAMEVLEHAQATLENDPTKVWLTGHSMGGHGTWTVGSHFPDRFAAIAPSAGWESFWSYGGGATFDGKHAVSGILTRAANPGRTLLRKYNYKQQGVYILHGDADDNVPVSEARRMRDSLREFHTDLQYFEQPGAGHWWDAGNDDGADCLDWQPIFDMFARRRLPRAHEVQEIDFTTVNPGHSADCHWARIEMQNVQYAPSRIQLKLRPARGHFDGTTDNVARLSLQLDGVMSPRESITLSLDGSQLEADWPASGRLHLRRDVDGWRIIEPPSSALKGPHRYGWFKDAFKHYFVYVYGTHGTDEENAANYDKARYDQEQWWYRANGSFEIVSDSAFRPADYVGRNIVLVGNADNNRAWHLLLKDCPVSVRDGVITLGDREVKGDDLALLFTYPIAGSEHNSVAVISGTGAKGIRLTNRMSYFVSGASYPDLMLFGPEMLQLGLGGVRAAGNFGEDWSLQHGELVWRQE